MIHTACIRGINEDVTKQKEVAVQQVRLKGGGEESGGDGGGQFGKGSILAFQAADGDTG